jgi:hypothetical protein
LSMLEKIKTWNCVSNFESVWYEKELHRFALSNDNSGMKIYKN